MPEPTPDVRRALAVADAVLAVRDTELQQLRDRADKAEAELQRLREESPWLRATAEDLATALAALARVARLADEYPAGIDTALVLEALDGQAVGDPEKQQLREQGDQLRIDLARQAQEMATWRATVSALDSGAPGTPRARAEQAEAAVARVEAECDRIEAAVRANPQDPDFDGAYLAAIGHVRNALNPQGECRRCHCPAGAPDCTHCNCCDVPDPQEQP